MRDANSFCAASMRRMYPAWEADCSERPNAESGGDYPVRVRQAGRRPPEATWKSLAGSGADPTGPGIRLGLGEILDAAEPAAIGRAGGPVGERVRALTGARPLVALFDVQTRRRVFPLTATGAASGELALDDTAIREPSGKILSRLRRVEVEVPPQARSVV